MKQLQVTARLKIHPGKLDDFKHMASKILAIVKEKDPGTQQYDWFFNADQSECIVRETYADSDAVLAHMGNLGDDFGKLLETAELQLEIFGEMSAELRAAGTSLNIVEYSYFQGLH